MCGLAGIVGAGPADREALERPWQRSATAGPTS